MLHVAVSVAFRDPSVMILRPVCVLLLGTVSALKVLGGMRNSPRATGNDLMSALGEIPQCAVSWL